MGGAGPLCIETTAWAVGNRPNQNKGREPGSHNAHIIVNRKSITHRAQYELRLP